MTKGEILYNILKEKYNYDELEKIYINKVVMNSQEIEKNDVFIAIRGGNKFVEEALNKGAYVIYDDDKVIIDKKYKNNYFLVDDSVKFMQLFAKKWRECINLKVIGITGSNGKTSVKDMIYHILKSKYKGKKTEGNLNNHIGLPFTLLRSEIDDEFMILEMGMSDFGEIDLLGEISKPNIGIITNIGESHLEYLKTKENVLKAKTELVHHLSEKLIINGDDYYLKKYVQIQNEKNINNFEIIKVLDLNKNSYIDNTSNFYYGDINFNESRTNFVLKYFGKVCNENVNRKFTTNVLGEHNILNLTIAIAVAKEFGFKDIEIEKEIENISMTDMRFQKIEKNDKIYINDAYNASPISMKKSLETFSKLYNERCKIIVIGDMLELGQDEEKYHSDLWEDVKNTYAQYVFLYGPRMKYLYNKLLENKNDENISNKKIEYFENKEIIPLKIDEIKEKKAILLKASRGMRLEEIIK